MFKVGDVVYHSDSVGNKNFLAKIIKYSPYENTYDIFWISEQRESIWTCGEKELTLAEPIKKITLSEFLED